MESTSPAAGATVPTPPASVSLTLSNHPLALGTQIKVNDAAGTNWADGAVEIVDNVASQKLKTGAPAGAYTVQWRVASSDGHPIEGTFTFTAAAGATAAAAAHRRRARYRRWAPPSREPPSRPRRRRTPRSPSRGAS